MPAALLPTRPVVAPPLQPSCLGEQTQTTLSPPTRAPASRLGLCCPPWKPTSEVGLQLFTAVSQHKTHLLPTLGTITADPRLVSGQVIRSLPVQQKSTMALATELQPSWRSPAQGLQERSARGTCYPPLSSTLKNPSDSNWLNSEGSNELQKVNPTASLQTSPSPPPRQCYQLPPTVRVTSSAEEAHTSFRRVLWPGAASQPVHILPHTGRLGRAGLPGPISSLARPCQSC